MQLRMLIIVQKESLTQKMDDIQTQINDLSSGENADSEETKKQISDLTDQKNGVAAELDGYKKAMDQAQSAVDQLNSQIQSVEASKTQIKSSISQIEDGKDTIRDNLTNCRADLLHYPERSLSGDRRYIRSTAGSCIRWCGFCKDAVRFLYGESTDQWCGRGSQCKEGRHGSSWKSGLYYFQ